MSLVRPGQLDYAAGMVRSAARHLIPEQGVWDVLNGLLDDDGSVYRRGGSALLSNASHDVTGLRFIWDGVLAPGARTIVGTIAGWATLSADDSTFHTSGTARGGTGGGPRKAVEIGGMLVIGGGAMTAGARINTDATAGSVTTTNGSKIVTGAGTPNWLSTVVPGHLFRVGAERWYVVASVESNTSLTLTEAYEGTTGGAKAYEARRSVDAPKIADIYAVAGDRLIACIGNKAHVSRGRSIGDPGEPPAGQLQWQTFDVNDFHELPEGVNIVGAGTVRDTVLLFTTRGVWSIGNLAFDLADPAGNPGRRVSVLTRDLIAWNHEGIASADNALVVPCADGVYLVDGISAPVELSVSIKPMLWAYSRLGYKVGGAAVYRNHYFMPIIDSLNQVVDFLVCRLDRPIRTRMGTIYPWTRIGGSAANTISLAPRVGTGTQRQPKLLAAERATTDRVLDLSGLFEPGVSNKNDHDATTHDLVVDTKDYGDGTREFFTKKLRLRYELEDAASDDPTLSLYYSVGVLEGSTALWDSALWGTGVWAAEGDLSFVQASGQAPEDDGRDPYVWRINKTNRFIRFRIRSNRPAKRLALRSLTLDVRPSGKP